MGFDTIAVDFDGTLCENRFPDIGEPKPLVIEYIKRQAATIAEKLNQETEGQAMEYKNIYALAFKVTRTNQNDREQQWT